MERSNLDEIGSFESGTFSPMKAECDQIFYTPIIHHYKIKKMNNQEVTWSFGKTKYTTTNTGPAVVSMAHLVLVPLPFFF